MDGKGNLMDAKANAVWLYEVDAGTDCACWFVVNRVDEGAVPFIPLTDHEAALAEQAERHAATEIDACNWASRASAAEQRLAQVQDELSNARRANATLLTGLEALHDELAGLSECGRHVFPADVQAIAKSLRTLTNSAKEST